MADRWRHCGVYATPAYGHSSLFNLDATNAENRNSAGAQCFMGLSDKANG